MVQAGTRSSGMSVFWCAKGLTDMWPTGVQLTQVPFKPRSGGKTRAAHRNQTTPFPLQAGVHIQPVLFALQV